MSSFALVVDDALIQVEVGRKERWAWRFGFELVRGNGARASHGPNRQSVHLAARHRIAVDAATPIDARDLSPQITWLDVAYAALLLHAMKAGLALNRPLARAAAVVTSPGGRDHVSRVVDADADRGRWARNVD